MSSIATSVGNGGRIFTFDEESKNLMYQKFQEEYGISVDEMFETYSKEEIFKSIAMFSVGYLAKEYLSVIEMVDKQGGVNC